MQVLSKTKCFCYFSKFIFLIFLFCQVYLVYQVHIAKMLKVFRVQLTLLRGKVHIAKLSTPHCPKLSASYGPNHQLHNRQKNVTLLAFQVDFILGAALMLFKVPIIKFWLFGCMTLNIYSLVAQTFFLFFPLGVGGVVGCFDQQPTLLLSVLT